MSPFNSSSTGGSCHVSPPKDAWVPRADRRYSDRSPRVGTIVGAILAAAGILNGADADIPFAHIPLESPVPAAAVDQRVAAAPDGGLVLSWTEKVEMPPAKKPEGHEKDKATEHAEEEAPSKARIYTTRMTGTQWETASLVAEVEELVESQVLPAGPGGLAAMWMVAKSTKEGEAHEIYAARRVAGGKTWSTPVRLNQEAKTSGKESPTVAALSDGTLLASWIDQRFYRVIPPTKPGEEPKEEGFSSLMVTSLSPENRVGKEMVVDKDFCSCCPPAILPQGREGLLVYREHLAGNVRDPAIMRISTRRFSEPSIVHNDHWVIEGCPSRGPAITGAQGSVAMGWLTMVEQKPHIRVGFSHDKGRKFSTPIEVEVEAAAGVSGIEMEDEHTAVVVWTTANKQGESIQVARVHDDGRVTRRTTLHASSAGSPYKWPGPRVTRMNDNLVVAWNDDQAKRLGIIRVNLAN